MGNAHQAAPIRINFLGNGNGYTMQYVSSGKYIDIDSQGNLVTSESQAPSQGFSVYSVSYHD